MKLKKIPHDVWFWLCLTVALGSLAVAASAEATEYVDHSPPVMDRELRTLEDKCDRGVAQFAEKALESNNIPDTWVYYGDLRFYIANMVYYVCMTESVHEIFEKGTRAHL